MRALILLAALALAACATPLPPPTPVAATGAAGVHGVATIAEWGTWEWTLAPVITRAEVIAYRLGRAAANGRITKARAMLVSQHLKDARDQLAASRRGDQAAPTPGQRAALANATGLLDQAAALLEPQP